MRTEITDNFGINNGSFRILCELFPAEGERLSVECQSALGSAFSWFGSAELFFVKKAFGTDDRHAIRSRWCELRNNGTISRQHLEALAAIREEWERCRPFVPPRGPAITLEIT